MHKNTKIQRQDCHIEKLQTISSEERQNSTDSYSGQTDVSIGTLDSGQTGATTMTVGSAEGSSCSGGSRHCTSTTNTSSSSGGGEQSGGKQGQGGSGSQGHHQSRHGHRHHHHYHGNNSNSSYSNSCSGGSSSFHGSGRPASSSASTKSTGSQGSAEIEAKERRFGSINLHPLPESMVKPDCFPGNFRYKIQRMGNLAEKARQIQMMQEQMTDIPIAYKENATERISKQEVIKDGWNSKVGIRTNEMKMGLTKTSSKNTSGTIQEYGGSTSNSSSSGHNASGTCKTNTNSTRSTNSNGAPRISKIGEYILEKTIGKGNFAVVKLATHQSLRCKTAVKIMNKTLIGLNNVEKVTREIDAMKRVEHPHIIKLYQVLETDTKIFMIMEYAEKGEVFDHISHAHAFTEKDARELFWQVVCAIHYCHKSGVVHRDLKAENLLLNANYQIKVADFGFSNFFESNKPLSTHCGSPQYAAPELFRGDPYDGPLADVWSLGVVLYIMVCGSFPFPGESLGDIRNQVLRGLVRFPFFLSTSCEYLVRGMLQVDPMKRFRIDQIINTPWMQASTNVDKYKTLMENFSKKAIEIKFEELFHRQHPEHSDIIREQSYHSSKVKIDAALLQALQIAGFDEDEVKNSVLNKSFDKSYAAYHLLKDKVCRFFNHPILRLYMDAAHSQIVEIAMTSLNQSQRCREESTSSSTITSSGTNTNSSSTSSSTTAGVSSNKQSIDEVVGSPPLVDSKSNVKEDLDAVMYTIHEQNKKMALDIQKNNSTDGTENSKQSVFRKKRGLSDSYYNSRRDSLTYVRGKLVAMTMHSEDRSSCSTLSSSCSSNEITSSNPEQSANWSSSQTSTRTNSIDHVDPLYTFSRLYYWVLESDEDYLMHLSEQRNQELFDENLKLQQASVRRHTVQLTEIPNELRTVTDLTNISAHTGFPFNMPEKVIGCQETITENPPIKSDQLEPMNTGEPHSNYSKAGTAFRIKQMSLDSTQSQNTAKLNQQHNNTKLMRNTFLPASPMTTGHPHHHHHPYNHHQYHHHHHHPYQYPQDQMVVSDQKNDLSRLTGSSSPLGLPEISEIPPNPDEIPQNIESYQMVVEGQATTEPISQGQYPDLSTTYYSSQQQQPQMMGSNDSMTGSSKLIHNLPQLNLPANIPALQHQPMAKFTIKDPHLLAPPDFMTPYNSCFPRRSSDGAADMQPLHRSNPGVGGSYPEQTAHKHRMRSSQNESLYDAVVKQVLPNTKDNLGGEISPLEFMGLHLKRFSLPMNNGSYQIPGFPGSGQQPIETGNIVSSTVSGISNIAIGAASIDYSSIDLLSPCGFRRGSEDSQMSLWHRRVARSGYIDSRSDYYGGVSAPSSRGSSPYPRQQMAGGGSSFFRRRSSGGGSGPSETGAVSHHFHGDLGTGNSPVPGGNQQTNFPGESLNVTETQIHSPVTAGLDLQELKAELQNLVPLSSNEKPEKFVQSSTTPVMIIPSISLSPIASEDSQHDYISSIQLAQESTSHKKSESIKENEENTKSPSAQFGSNYSMEPLYVSSEAVSSYQKQMYFNWFPGFIRSANAAYQTSSLSNQSSISQDKHHHHHPIEIQSGGITHQYQQSLATSLANNNGNTPRSISSPQQLMMTSSQQSFPSQSSSSYYGDEMTGSQFPFPPRETAPMPPPLPYYSPFIRDEDAADLAAIERVNRKIVSGSNILPQTHHHHISIGQINTSQSNIDPPNTDSIGQAGLDQSIISKSCTDNTSSYYIHGTQSALELCCTGSNPVVQLPPDQTTSFHVHQIYPRRRHQLIRGYSAEERHSLDHKSDSMDCEPSSDPQELSTIQEQMDAT